jgi:glucose-6-phosphate isomerase
LRAPELAPDRATARAVSQARYAVARFAGAVRAGRIRGAGGTFRDLIHIGIGGSALGPQLLCDVIGNPANPVTVHFLDNADPDGLETVLARLRSGLGRTLVSVVSKSGITPTPLLVLSELERRYRAAGLSLAGHAVATTMPGSDLAKRVTAEGWLASFPIWEWVGGRTSVTSAVGLLPGAVLGGNTGAFLAGAAAMDRRTRDPHAAGNPAMLLALMWFWLGQGAGRRDMVVLPYRDRLALLPRYVQQLVMESIGKRHDRRGRVVRQGLTVYGNKGSTDQHAYFQQLLEGPPDFFVTFVRTRQAAPAAAPAAGPAVGPATLDDYLFASAEGARERLSERGRESITITLPDLGPRSLGALIALFERATGLYAELIDVNAYDQPAVDKHLAEPAVALQRSIRSQLDPGPGGRTAAELAAAIGQPERVEAVYAWLEQLAATPGRGVTRTGGTSPDLTRFHLDRTTSTRPEQGGGRA